MRFPKNFHPVGVLKHGIPRASATTSSAAEEGIDRATPLGPPALAKCGMASQLSQMSAILSDGVTKHPAPAMRFRSPSPSLAAPSVGRVEVSTLLSALPSDARPIFFTRSDAYVKFGSGWIPPKSGFGSHRSNDDYACMCVCVCVCNDDDDDDPFATARMGEPKDVYNSELVV